MWSAPPGYNIKFVHRKSIRHRRMRYLAVLDFEATCWSDKPDHEIIEWPTVVVDLQTLEVVDEFRVFVRPKRQPVLSAFCIELTGITQDQVDAGLTLKAAWKAHARFMARYADSVFVTCGDWDLGTMLPADCRNNGLRAPAGPYSRWINIKSVFARYHPDVKKAGMMLMLSTLGVDHVGRHHSGLDDCRNIANICVNLIQTRGWVPQ